MKRVFRNNRLIMIAFFTVFSVATAPMVMASGTHPTLPVELKLIGSLKNQPLFELTFNGNAEENDFLIIIRDDWGNALYRENIKGEIFSKKFLINTEAMADDDSFTFEIISKKTNKNVVYEINNNHRMVEETMINKIK